jgi:DNA-binding Lrp family transcriptional regulator
MNQELYTHISEMLRLTEVSDSTRDEIIAELGGITFETILRVVVEILPEDKLAEFEVLLRGNDMKEMTHFLATSVENLDAIVKECSTSVVNAYLKTRD